MRAGIALGSNLGDRLASLRAACAQLRQSAAIGGPLRFSRVYETEPVGTASDAGAFLNAVVEVEFEGHPLTLLDELQAIEGRLGRPSKRPRHASRTIDLDVLYVGNLALTNEEIVIPHPRLHARRFVLQPLCDLRPELVLPGQHKTVLELLAGLADEGQVRLCKTNWRRQNERGQFSIHAARATARGAHAPSRVPVGALADRPGRRPLPYVDSTRGVRAALRRGRRSGHARTRALPGARPRRPLYERAGPRAVSRDEAPRRAHRGAHGLRLPDRAAARRGRARHPARGRFAGHGGARLRRHDLGDHGRDRPSHAGRAARHAAGAHRGGPALCLLRNAGDRAGQCAATGGGRRRCGETRRRRRGGGADRGHHRRGDSLHGPHRHVAAECAQRRRLPAQGEDRRRGRQHRGRRGRRAARGWISVVLELVKPAVAERISAALEIPTIGIAAGSGCDGEVLVSHDLFGLFPWFTPRHVKRQGRVAEEIRAAAARFVAETKRGG